MSSQHLLEQAGMEDDDRPQVPSSRRTYGISVPGAPSRAASKALIEATGGQLQIGNFLLNDIGLEYVGPDKPLKQDWENVGVALRRVYQAFRWLLADWLALGEDHKWGAKYEEVAKWTGLKEKTLREYAYVAANVSLSIRMDNLKFAHHQLVAPLSRNK